MGDWLESMRCHSVCIVVLSLAVLFGCNRSSNTAAPKKKPALLVSRLPETKKERPFVLDTDLLTAMPRDYVVVAMRSFERFGTLFAPSGQPSKTSLRLLRRLIKQYFGTDVPILKVMNEAGVAVDKPFGFFLSPGHCNRIGAFVGLASRKRLLELLEKKRTLWKLSNGAELIEDATGTRWLIRGSRLFIFPQLKGASPGWIRELASVKRSASLHSAGFRSVLRRLSFGRDLVVLMDYGRYLRRELKSTEPASKECRLERREQKQSARIFAALFGRELGRLALGLSFSRSGIRVRMHLERKTSSDSALLSRFVAPKAGMKLLRTTPVGALRTRIEPKKLYSAIRFLLKQSPKTANQKILGRLEDEMLKEIDVSLDEFLGAFSGGIETYLMKTKAGWKLAGVVGLRNRTPIRKLLDYMVRTFPVQVARVNGPQILFAVNGFHLLVQERQLLVTNDRDLLDMALGRVSREVPLLSARVRGFFDTRASFAFLANWLALTGKRMPKLKIPSLDGPPTIPSTLTQAASKALRKRVDVWLTPRKPDKDSVDERFLHLLGTRTGPLAFYYALEPHRIAGLAVLHLNTSLFTLLSEIMDDRAKYRKAKKKWKKLHDELFSKIKQAKQTPANTK